MPHYAPVSHCWSVNWKFSPSSIWNCVLVIVYPPSTQAHAKVAKCFGTNHTYHFWCEKSNMVVSWLIFISGCASSTDSHPPKARGRQDPLRPFRPWSTVLVALMCLWPNKEKGDVMTFLAKVWHVFLFSKLLRCFVFQLLRCLFSKLL